MSSDVVNEAQNNIQNKMRELFAQGSLSTRIQLTQELSRMEGLELFNVELPWEVTLGKSQPIKGRSETLQLAVSDIQSILATHAKEKSPDTLVSISVAKTRAHTPQQQGLARSELDGGPQ